MENSLILNTVQKIFADHGDINLLNDEKNENGSHDALWSALIENGLNLASVSEDGGGFGLSMGEWIPLVGAAARVPSPVPFAETLFAHWLADIAGLASNIIGEGGATYALNHGESNGQMGVAPGLFSIASKQGAFLAYVNLHEGGHEGEMLFYKANGLDIKMAPALAPSGLARPWFHKDKAGGDREDLLLGRVSLSAMEHKVSASAVEAVHYALLTQQMAGAMAGALALARDHVTTREQFGRPLARFQAIQQPLAIAASEAAAASMAATLAINACEAYWREAPERAWREAVAAKLTVSERIEDFTATMHQVHGAIGYTHEYKLHHYTRRLWAWREEGGNEAYLADRLGESLSAWPPQKLWEAIIA